MSEHPKVSIIVPIYNVEQYLRRCIDSLLAQTYTNIEIVLVTMAAQTTVVTSATSMHRRMHA